MKTEQAWQDEIDDGKARGLSAVLSFNVESCWITTIGLLILILALWDIKASLVGGAAIGMRWGAHFDLKRKIRRLKG